MRWGRAGASPFPVLGVQRGRKEAQTADMPQAGASCRGLALDASLVLAASGWRYTVAALGWRLLPLLARRYTVRPTKSTSLSTTQFGGHGGAVPHGVQVP